MNWKKLTSEELNKTIASQRSKQTKNKSHVLVCKTYQRTGHCSITIQRDKFQLNLVCFHMVTNEDFATVLDACWRSVVFITPPPIWPPKRTLVSAEQLAR